MEFSQFYMPSFFNVVSIVIVIILLIIIEITAAYASNIVSPALTLHGRYTKLASCLIRSILLHLRQALLSSITLDMNI